MSKIDSISAMVSALGEDHVKKLITKVLESGVSVVEFKKDNGEHRVMHCTLLESAIPTDKLPQMKRNKGKKAIYVWDVEKNDWRSFKIGSVECIHLA